MDNLTHSLVGLAAAKSGLERLSPGATALCVLADSPTRHSGSTVPRSLGFLQHHRGISCTSWNGGFDILLPLLFCRRFHHFKDKKAAAAGKIRSLLIVSLVVTFTHPLLDWTNNYGIRPFLP
jgi:inner membrane protein